MTRKHTHRRIVVPLPPRGLRPKLASDQLRDLGLCHWENLDAIARGAGTVDILWSWVGSVLTWSRVAELLHAGVPELRDQLALCERVILRFKRTGRVVFTGPEYQLAKDGVAAMDQLAEIVDRPTAMVAAEWSEARINELWGQNVKVEVFDSAQMKAYGDAREAAALAQQEPVANEPCVSYTHVTSGTRFRQYRKDPLPPWAYDVQPAPTDAELIASPPRQSAEQAALEAARPIVEAYARANPPFTAGGETQDPMGAHAWLAAMKEKP